MSSSILENVQRYYTAQLRTHGATPRGVDWNSPESQRLRFVQLLKLIDRRAPFTINDYGCGYGALADYLQDEGYSCEYRGFDISREMVDKAREVHEAMGPGSFVNEESGLTKADYTVASGIFNVKLQTEATEWERYILQTLATINNLSGKGFAFNVLTKYSDAEFMRPDLYYADPLFLFDHCKRKFSQFVSLIHDYPLYEFTLLIRKEQSKW